MISIEYLIIFIGFMVDKFLRKGSWCCGELRFESQILPPTRFANLRSVNVECAQVNGLIAQGQVWRLLTSSFLHANIMHLMVCIDNYFELFFYPFRSSSRMKNIMFQVNSYSLNSIGPLMEKITGPRRFLAIYFSSAIASRN